MQPIQAKTALTLIGVIAAATGPLWTSLPAQAFTVTHSGVDYDITTRTGTFDSLKSLLIQQPWWASTPAEETSAKALAEILAGLLETNLGLPNVPIQGPSNTLPIGTFEEGPYFAFFQTGNEISEINWDNDGGVEEDTIDLDNSISMLFDEVNNPITTPARDVAFSFAIVEPTQSVPTPALLPAMLGMGASIIRRRKKQASA